MKAKIALVLVSIVVAVSIIEVGLRVFWSNPYSGSGTDRVLKLRVHHANIEQTFSREQIDDEHPIVTYRTNNRGYIEPAPGEESIDLRIAFLGGSTTECFAVREEYRFPFLVGALLTSDTLSVGVLNAARSGGTLHDSINVLFNHVVLDRPDVVVLMHASNDIGLLKKDPEYGTRMGHEVSGIDIGKYMLQMVSARLSLAGYLRQVATAGEFERGTTVGHARDTEADTEPFRARLEVFVSMSRAFGMVPVLMTQPMAANIRNELTPAWVDANAQGIFNDVIRKVGEATGADVIDLAEYVTNSIESEDELKRVFYDGLHVTDHGSSLYAAYVAERLADIINKRL
jgi:lysophospholipase L1-like esterase